MGVPPERIWAQKTLLSLPFYHLSRPIPIYVVEFLVEQSFEGRGISTRWWSDQPEEISGRIPRGSERMKLLAFDFETAGGET